MSREREMQSYPMRYPEQSCCVHYILLHAYTLLSMHSVLLAYGISSLIFQKCTNCHEKVKYNRERDYINSIYVGYL